MALVVLVELRYDGSPVLVRPPSEAGRAFRMRRDADVIRTGTGDEDEDGDAVATDAKDDDAAADDDKEEDAAVADKTTEVAAAGDDASEGEADADAQDGEGDDEDEEEDLPVIELPEVDYQLEKALLVLRAQLIQDHGFSIMPRVKTMPSFCIK